MSALPCGSWRAGSAAWRCAPSGTFRHRLAPPPLHSHPHCRRAAPAPAQVRGHGGSPGAQLRDPALPGRAANPSADRLPGAPARTGGHGTAARGCGRAWVARGRGHRGVGCGGAGGTPRPRLPNRQLHRAACRPMPAATTPRCCSTATLSSRTSPSWTPLSRWGLGFIQEGVGCWECLYWAPGTHGTTAAGCGGPCGALCASLRLAAGGKRAPLCVHLLLHHRCLQGDGSMSRDSLHFDVDTAIKVRWGA